MVTEVKVNISEVIQVKEAEHIDFEQFGELLGIPITVRPWWGSNRQRGGRHCAYCDFGLSSYLPRYCYHCHKDLKLDEIVIEEVAHTWECAGGQFNGNIYKAPEVQDGKIILWEGPCGFNHPKKGHSQEIKVRDVQGKTILIAIWVRQLWSCWLIGVDGRAPFVVSVQRRATTVQEAFDWLMPVMVKRAIAAGLDVKRQGDWYFIPVYETPKSLELGGFPHSWQTVPFSNPALARHVLYSDVNLIYGGQTRHRAEQVVYNSVLGIPHSAAPFVKGRVSAPDHEDLYLPSWHLAIRNKSTTGGRRENARGMDD